jgi:hypothetical protein
MNNFLALKVYFQSMADSHVLLQGNFVHGGISKLRADVLSKMKYPLMWFETPMIEIYNTGSAIMANKKSAIVILGQMNANNRTDDQQDDTLDQLEGIALDIISKLRKDAVEGIHKINISECDLDPIDPLLVDNCIGWRFEFTITNAINICYIPENWI